MDFRDYLKARCKERGISLHRLALLCDLNQIYFYQAVTKNKENPPPWVLRRAAPHLGVATWSCWSRPAIWSPVTSRSGPRGAARRLLRRAEPAP